MSDAKVELWLVRHGETAWSLSGAHTSFTDIPLTDRGRERAVELRNYLQTKPFAAVLVSPRQRAQETARIAGFGEVMQTEDDLVEWNYGESEGKTTKEMREKYGDPAWSVWTRPIVGGETVEQVGDRADAVIARALALAKAPAAGQPEPGGTQRVALFAHAHILRILAARWIGLPATGGKSFAFGTGAVSVLGFERETRVIAHWNREFDGD
ncbi:MAG TPA: histidine phosphatase family protein [Acidobacteriaceae bacterium]|nr:histidine phosphatase family protein [Acidobacteriaceae bacterium]